MTTTESAYDGSTGAQKRELTPLERDILCRVLSDVITHARRNPPRWVEFDGIGGIQFSPVPVRVGESDFLLRLCSIYQAINPRSEE